MSHELVALMVANRVRYVEKHHGPVYSAVHRAAVICHAFSRPTDPAHRQALRAVADRGGWDPLLHATFCSGEQVAGSIIIPAHSEAAVTGRTLSWLGELPY